jgi:Uroporphyrinogen decarboxylase (URO-D)
MTSRERVEAALRHQEPDRTPIFEYVVLYPVAERFLARPSAENPVHWDALEARQGWELAVRQLARDRLDLACLLGHDMIYAVPAPTPKRPRQTPPAEPPEPSADPVERVRLRNERARHVPPFDEGHFMVYRCLKDEMTEQGVDLPLMAPAYGHGVWTDTDLMMTMLVAPDVAAEHFALATERMMAWVEAYLDLGIDMIGVGGDFAGNRPLISPESYRTFMVPEVRKLSRRIHEGGRFAVNASDGDLWSVLDDFLFGCEVDGYLEIDYQAGMDMRRLKDAYGDRVVLFGNLDCGNVLSFGTVDEVRQHVIDCIEAGMGNGGHIFSASNAITDSVPMENYLTVVNAYRVVFDLPKLEFGG